MLLRIREYCSTFRLLYIVLESVDRCGCVVPVNRSVRNEIGRIDSRDTCRCSRLHRPSPYPSKWNEEKLLPSRSHWVHEFVNNFTETHLVKFNPGRRYSYPASFDSSYWAFHARRAWINPESPIFSPEVLREERYKSDVEERYNTNKLP